MEFESQPHKVQLGEALQCIHRGQCFVSVHVCDCAQRQPGQTEVKSFTILICLKGYPMSTDCGLGLDQGVPVM